MDIWEKIYMWQTHYHTVYYIWMVVVMYSSNLVIFLAILYPLLCHFLGLAMNAEKSMSHIVDIGFHDIPFRLNINNIGWPPVNPVNKHTLPRFGAPLRHNLWEWHELLVPWLIGIRNGEFFYKWKCKNWERMREYARIIETFPINAGNSIAMFYYQRVVWNWYKLRP